MKKQFQKFIFQNKNYLCGPHRRGANYSKRLDIIFVGNLENVKQYTIRAWAVIIYCWAI